MQCNKDVLPETTLMLNAGRFGHSTGVGALTVLICKSGDMSLPDEAA